jgi:D-serine deaminase-like pyridoxal phosphate-dependent protein
MQLADIPTPALLLERSILERNLDRMAARARRLGVALRPHVKTHKCVEVARRQAERGARGFTVSTLPEAEALAAAGFEDLTWALPLEPSKIGSALRLARRVTLRLLLDDAETFRLLETAAAGAGTMLHAWLKVDCGYHRAGVDPESPEAFRLARRMSASRAVRFDGLLTHAGHAYGAFDPAARRRIAEEEREAVVEFARRLREDGVRVPEVSVGSTPTLTIVEDLAGVTEARPGNYAFFDLTQVALGCCDVADVAVSVLASVISHPAGSGRAVVDAGALALSKDPGPQAPEARDMGAVCADALAPAVDPSLRLVSLSQEHGVIRPVEGADLAGRLPVGARVRILPNHSCLATACHDVFHVVDGGRVVDRWRIQRQR